MKNVSAGANPIVIRKGIQKAVDKAVETLKSCIRRSVNGSADIARVGTISAGDEVIGNSDRRRHGEGHLRRRHHR